MSLTRTRAALAAASLFVCAMAADASSTALNVPVVQAARALVALRPATVRSAVTTTAAPVCATAMGEPGAWNGFFFGNYSAPSSDVQGRLAAAGSISISNYSIADKLPATFTGPSLLAGGNITFPSGRVYYGDIVAGGSAAGVGAPVRNGLSASQHVIEHATPIDFAAEWDRAKAWSAALAALPTNTTYESKWGGLYLHGDNVSNVQVFSLPGNLVVTSNTYVLDKVPANATIVLNVTGTSSGLKNVSVDAFQNWRTRTVWNFHQATTLTFAGIGVQGTVLAPLADIPNPQGVVWGGVVAKSWNGPMQLNLVGFTGCGLPNYGTNRAPVATPQTVATAEDTVRSLTLAATDADNDPLTYRVVTPPAHGTLSGTAPNLTYTPAANYNGADSFTFVANDSRADSAPATVSITITPVNDAPVASAQTLVATQPQALNLTLAGSDVDGDALTFRVVQQPAHGTLSGTAPTLTYTPATHYLGPDFFTVVANDGRVDSATARIDVNVTGSANRAPVAGAQTVHVNEDGTLSLTLAATDADNDALTYRVTAAPTHGTLSGTAPTLTYTPAANYNGADTLAFVANDGWTDSAAAAISVTIDPVNDAPVATAQTLHVQKDQALAVTLAATDVDGDTVTFRVTQQPAHGTLTGSGATLSYTPASGYVGADGFSFVANDGHVDSAATRIDIAVDRPPNRAPTATAQTAAIDEDGTLAITLAGTDPDGDTLSFRVSTPPAHGTLSGTAPNLTYTPAANYNGSDTFAFVANDGTVDSVAAAVSIAIAAVNDVPVVTTTAPATVLAGQPYVYDVDATDADGDALTYALVAPPAGASIDAATGVVTWTPSDAQVGTRTVTITVSDGHGGVATQAVSVQVVASNHAPVITSVAPTQARVDETLVYDADATDPDAGDTLTYALDPQPAGATIDAATGLVQWTPTSAQLGAQSLGLVVRDSHGATATQAISVTVLPANHVPQITSTPTTTVALGATHSYDVVATDADAGDTLSYALAQGPAGMTLAPGGHLSWNANIAPAGGQERQNTQCIRAPRPGVIDPVVKWQWTGSTVLPDYKQVMAAPLVARLFDSNGDGRIDTLDHPDIVAVTYKNDRSSTRAPAIIRNFDGVDGTELAHTSELDPVDGFAGAPALGDLDGDGRIDIVALTYDGSLAAYAPDGTLEWKRPGVVSDQPFFARGTVAIEDLDGDGHPEIIAAFNVFRSNGQPYWQLYEYRGLNNRALGDVLAFADLDGDGKPEILAGGIAYRGDSSMLWANYDVGDGYDAVADVDGDGKPDVVVVSNGKVSLLNAQGVKQWGPVALPGGGYGGPATIADMDGDGHPDIGVAGAHAYTVFKADGSILWTQTTRDASSQTTGSTVADLDGDGRAEVLYGDERTFRIYRGVDGEVLFERVNTTGTIFEFPVFADVDGRSGGEIVIVSNDYLQNHHQDDVPATNGLTVLKSATDGWLPTRAIWNQHAYHIDNVRDDGSIPAHVVDSWTTHNTYRLNTFADHSPFAQADLALFDLRYVEDAGGRHLVVRARNRGLVASDSTTVRFYAGDPAGGGTLLGESALPVLAANEARDVALLLAANANLGDVAYAVVDPGSQVVECIENNNVTNAHIVRLRAVDGAGAAATQTYALSVLPQNHGPTLITTSLPSAQAEVLYTTQVQASDPDRGDALKYTLLEGPQGLTLDPVDGQIQWTPARGQQGNNTVHVRIEDLSGLAQEGTWSIAVAAGANRAPSILSTAVLTAAVGQAYAYDVDATDPDAGDTLTYALLQAPNGMSIDAITGRITWTPATGQDGTADVQVEVRDNHGASAMQSWTIAVAAAPHVNHAPSIVSTPTGYAKVGHPYTYDVEATDPDGDTLEYSLRNAPFGMTIDALTGLIRWTPTTNANVVVIVRAADASMYAEQTIELTVQSADTPLQAHVTVTPPNPAPGTTITVTVTTSGAGGPLTIDGTLDSQPLPLDADGTTELIAPTQTGPHTVGVSVIDGTDSTSASATFTVIDPSDTTPPVVQLTSPLDNAEVTMPTSVLGSVSDANLASWTLYVRDANSPNATPTVLGTGTTNVSNAPVGKFDPTLLFNGQYTLILQATDIGGNVASASAVIRVTGDMKVGNFSITFEDANIPVAGIPVRVTRTYDTRQRNENLDFGKGWSVDYQNVRVRESGVTGFSWLAESSGGPFGTVCVHSNGDRVVTVTLPDGKVQSFRAKASPECQPFAAAIDVNLVYEPIDNTQTTLEQLDYGLLRVSQIAGSSDVNLIDLDTQSNVDPRHYRLTTVEGMVYDLDQFFGITKVTDPSGNTLTYSASGVQHSSGIGISFERDAQNRITRMTLPDATHIDYVYTAAGDLDHVSDQLEHPTAFTYLANMPHYLKDIVDARGVRVSRNEYDTEGRLTATTDAEGHRIEYTHAIDARTETIKDRRGNSSSFVYDDNGWVLAETDQLGHTTQHTYDANGYELTRTTPMGHTTTWTYDRRGNALTVTDPLGRVTGSVYDVRNNPLIEIDAVNRARFTNVYDQTYFQLVERIDAQGHGTTYGYDHGVGSWQTGKVRSIRDPLGNTTTFVNDIHGFAVSTTDALGHTTTYTNDALGRHLTETTTRSGDDGNIVSLTTVYTYDARGQEIAIQRPDGTTTTTEYNAIGKPVKSCDAFGRCITTIYSQRGEATKTIYPNGTSDARTFDPNGNLLTETDRDGHITHYVYDNTNHRTETVEPDDTPNDDGDNPIAAQIYDADGRIVATSDPLGNVTTFGYDDANRLVSVTDALGHVTRSRYDATGRRISMTDALSRTTSYQYDDVGRLVATIYDDGTRNSAEFDIAGNKIGDIDQAGRITRYAYDALGRLVRVVLANPDTGANPALENGRSLDGGTLTTTYLYDELGNKIAQEDALGRVTRWAYDDAGRLLTRTLPMGQVEAFAYDAGGRRISHIDFRGRKTIYRYVANTDELQSIEYPNDAAVQMSYTPGGSLNRIVDGNGATTYSYDAKGRLTQVTWPNGLALSYAYDLAGNRIRLHTDNQDTRYTFDELNRLKSVTEQAQREPMATYTYDAVGNRQSVTLANNVRTEYTYNRLNRLTGVTHTAGTAMPLSVSYSLDPSGMRAAIDETGDITRRVTYTYDSVKRLINEEVASVAGSRSTRWTYDAVGNRLSQVKSTVVGTDTTIYSYDSNDRLLQDVTTGPHTGVTMYGYDEAGNQLSKQDASGLTQYLYNDASRVAELRTNNGEVTKYTYNHDGICLSQTSLAGTANEITAHYVLDPNTTYAQVVEQYMQQPGNPRSLVAVYTIGDDRIRQLRPAVNGSGSNSGVPASLRYYHADGLGSTRLLTNQDGVVTDHYAFEAFGTLEDGVSNMSSSNDFLFAGEQFDTSSKLYNLRARQYDPALGRFARPDDFSGFGNYPLSLNRYVYALNDPAEGVDHSGNSSLLDLSISMTVLAATIGGASSSPPLDLKEDSDERYIFHQTFMRPGDWLYRHINVEKFPSGSTSTIVNLTLKPLAKDFSDNGGRQVGAIKANIEKRWNIANGGPSRRVYSVYSYITVDEPNEGIRLLRLEHSGDSECRDRAPKGGHDIFVCKKSGLGVDTYAHEYGHILGFEDSYKRATSEPFPGHREDLMATDGGSGFVDWYLTKLLGEAY